MIWIIIGIIVILLGLFVATTYNKLVRAKNNVLDQWAQVDVNLKRRFDLIPNLVETVKGYATHEEDTLKQVIQARANFSTASNIEEEMAASNMLTQAMGKLMAVAESYPDLKANINFMDLQTQLKETEDKISFARQFFNDTTLSYNNIVEQFPSNIVAMMFKFKTMAYFKIADAEATAPQVKF